MSKLLKNLALIAVTMSLTACLYRPNIQQGNVITPDMLAQVKVGMTQEQVKYALGTPVLVNTFDPSRWNYVYTYKQGSKPMVKQDITLTFNQGILQAINSTPLIKPSSH